MSQTLDICPEALKLKHPFTFIVSGPTQSGKTFFVFKLLENLSKITDPPIFEIVYIYNAWQEGFNKYKNRVFFTNDLKYLKIRPKNPTLIVCDDFMSQIGKNKDMFNLFIRDSHHNGVSIVLILQNIFEKDLIGYRRNTHYYYLTEHLQDRRSIEHFARQLEPKNSKYFMKSYEDATSYPFGGLFIDVHPHSTLRLISKYRTGIHQFKGQVLYIPEK